MSVLAASAAGAACWSVLVGPKGAGAASTQGSLAAGAASTAFCQPSASVLHTASTQGLLMPVLAASAAGRHGLMEGDLLTQELKSTAMPSAEPGQAPE